MPEITRVEQAIVNLENKLKTLTDPADIARTTGNLEKLKAKLGSGQSYSGYQPPSESVSPMSQPSDSVRKPAEGGSKFWYEPTAEDVRNQLSSDPKLAQRLNLQSWTSSPDQLDSINESSTAFQTVADDQFKRDQEEARSRGVSLGRYKDVSLVKNPFDYISGGIGKYAPGMGIAALRGASGGTLDTAVRGARSSTDFNARDSYSLPDVPQETPEQSSKASNELIDSMRSLQDRAGTAGTVSEIGGAFMPFSPGNAVTRGVTDALGYEAGGVARKAAASVLGGAAAANLEGTVADVNQGLHEGKSWEDIAKQSVEMSPFRTGVGGLIGGGFDLGGQVAGKVAKSRAIGDQDLKLLREAGGETDTIRGVVAPQSIKDNINTHYEGRTGEVGYPEDIAAGKVAPQIKESLVNETSAERDRIGQETEAYLNHPAVRDQKESMKGLAENVISMFQKGAFEAPLTGDLTHVNPEAVNTFKKLLASIGEVKYVTPEESMMFARQSDGIVLDGRHMKGLGIEPQAGKVPVYVPAKTNARSLLDMEEMIDEKLKMAGTPGGINNPIWKRVNQSVKGIRDRFGVEQPKPNDLGPTFAPAADIPQPPVVGVNQPPTNITGPAAPEAIPGIGPTPIRNPGELPNPFNPYQPYQPPIDVQAQNPVGVNLPRPPVDEIGLQPGVRFNIPDQPRGIDAIQPQRPVVVGNQPARQVAQPVPVQEPIASTMQPPASSSADYMSVSPEPVTLAPNATIPSPSTGGNPEADAYERLIQDELNRVNAGRAKTEMSDETARGATRMQMPIEERIKYNDNVSSMNRELEEGLNRDVRTRENDRLKGWTTVAEEQSPQSFYDRVMGKTSNPTEPVDISESAAPMLSDSTPPSIVGKSLEDLKALPIEGASDRSRVEALKLDKPFAETGRVTSNDGKKGITLVKEDDGLVLRDGRHRLTAAQEMGRADVHGQVIDPKTNKVVYEGPIPVNDMARRSSEAAYEPGTIIANDGKYNPDDIKAQVSEQGVDSAGRLKKSMREESSRVNREKYVGKDPNEVASKLEHPVKVQLDNGNLMLRDGRHALDEAKKAGATVINTKVHVIDENGKAVEIGTFPLPIYPNGLPKKVIADATKDPPKYTATLEDGTVVHGLSALRRQQHLAQQKLDELVNKTGTGRDVVAQRVIGFGSGPGQAAQDAALLEQAKKLGLEKELRETAGTAAYQRLLHRLKLSSAKGPWSGVVDFFGTRIDPTMRAMAGQAPNPFIPAPTSPAGRIQQYLFETQPKNALNLTRGLPAARSAPYIEEHYKDKDKKK